MFKKHKIIYATHVVWEIIKHAVEVPRIIIAFVWCERFVAALKNRGSEGVMPFFSPSESRQFIQQAHGVIK